MDPTVTAAIITAVPAALAAVGTAWHRSNKRAKKLEKNIGESNGQGNVIEMLEYLKAWTIRHEGRHDLLESQWDRH